MGYQVSHRLRSQRIMTGQPVPTAPPHPQKGQEAGLTALFIEAAATEEEELGRTSTAVFSKLTLSRLNFIPSK